jgi:hypothetical protein
MQSQTHGFVMIYLVRFTNFLQHSNINCKDLEILNHFLDPIVGADLYPDSAAISAALTGAQVPKTVPQSW